MRAKRAIVMSLLLVTLATYGSCASGKVAATNSQTDGTILEEPMFGLGYSYAHENVHYDLMPANLTRLCSVRTPTWIYAHVKKTAGSSPRARNVERRSSIVLWAGSAGWFM